MYPEPTWCDLIKLVSCLITRFRTLCYVKRLCDFVCIALLLQGPLFCVIDDLFLELEMMCIDAPEHKNHFLEFNLASVVDIDFRRCQMTVMPYYSGS